MRRGVEFSISKFICPECGMSMSVPRSKGQKRKDNHKKTLFCPRCNKRRNMVEQKDYI